VLSFFKARLSSGSMTNAIFKLIAFPWGISVGNDQSTDMGGLRQQK